MSFSDRQIEIGNMLLREGFSVKQVEFIVDAGIVDPSSLAGFDLSEWWETYRAIYV